MNDISQIRLSVIIHSAAAIVTGLLSVYLTSLSRTLFAGIAGIVILIVIGFITQKLTQNKDRKWWLSNGVVVFLLVWLVSWTTFHNLGL